MADLYPVLLKNVEQKQFGVNLTNIIMLKKQGEVEVKTTKLAVIYDGEKQELINCQSVTVKFENDTIILDIVPVNEGDVQTTVDGPQAEDVPQIDVVVQAAATDTFLLQGDDLEGFELLSDFRRAENQGQKTESDILEAHTLMSGTFDIQDIMSVQNAILDIIEKEKYFIGQEYKVFKTNVPRFDYENSNNFTLVESVVLIKSVTAPVKELN
jgi:hypothetical protein